MNPGRLVSGSLRYVAVRVISRQAALWRRRKLVMRLRLNAWMTRSTLELAIAKDVAVGKRIGIEMGAKSVVSLRVGSGSKLREGVELRLHGGKLHLGEKVDIRQRAILTVSDGGALVLDGPNNLSYGVTIHCSDSVHLAKFAHVAEYSTIVDNSHYYSDPDGWSYHNLRTAPIELEQDVWVCPKATITSGVTIGDHSIVASNTVVVKSMPSGVLISGVPGKIVRDVDLPWRTPAPTRREV